MKPKKRTVWSDPRRREIYYKKNNLKTASPHLLKAIEKEDIKTALELGSGAGVDAKELDKRGIKVTAVDINSEAEKFLKDTNIKFVKSAFRDFTFGKYDLIHARNSMVFMDEEDYYELLEKIKESLNPGGIFVTRLWGEKDSTNRPSNKRPMTFTTKEKIKKIFKNFDLSIEETEIDKPNALGREKHWHFIDIVAKK